MDPYTFSSLISELRGSPFSKGKCDILQSSASAQGYYSGQQVKQVLDQFHHSSEKPDALRIIENRLAPMTCHDGAHVMKSASFDKDRLRILEYIARHLTDATTADGRHAIKHALSFSRDHQRADDILNRNVGTAYPGSDNCHHHHQHSDLGRMVHGAGEVVGGALGAVFGAAGKVFKGNGHQNNPPSHAYPRPSPQPAGSAYPSAPPTGAFPSAPPAGSAYPGPPPAGSAYPGGPPAGSAYPGGPPAGSAYPGGAPAGSAYPGGPPAGSAYPGGPPAGSAYPGGQPAGSAYPSAPSAGYPQGGAYPQQGNPGYPAGSTGYPY